MKRVDEILIEPVVTEKTNRMREVNKYVFKVSLRANKLEVEQAIASLYNVKPIKCNIIQVKGKPKKVRYKQGYTSHWKKAIITLRENEKIPIFEGV